MEGREVTKRVWLGSFPLEVSIPHSESVPNIDPLLVFSPEELLNLLGSGLAGVGEEELEEALGRGREEGGGRESRVGVYEISDPQLQVRCYTGNSVNSVCLDLFQLL